MTLWALAFICSTALGAVGFVVVAVLWLRKLREALSRTLADMAGRQLRATQNMGESLAQLHRQNQNLVSQVKALTEDPQRMKKEINRLEGQIDPSDWEGSKPSSSRLLH